MVLHQVLSLIFLTCFIFKCNCDTFEAQILKPRQLYPFRAYKDVQLFQYTVPTQVSFASFQYKANGSVHCPIKTIVVYLQYGSYPIVNPQGASYPDHFIVQRLFLHNVTLYSNSVSKRINITNPFPGNWYAAAFLIENTDRIEQKGLSTPCYSRLSSSLHLNVAENVINIPQDLELSQNITGTRIYRFYGMKEGWSSTVLVQNCIPSYNGSCPVVVYVRQFGIPFTTNGYEHLQINCSTLNAELCMLPIIPAMNDWNYITIQSLVPDLTFSLKVETKDCNSTFSDESLNQGNNDVPNQLNICWAKISLVRISLPTNLSFEYNLPANEDDLHPFLLNITNSRYTFSSFNVFPTVDIGGTLVLELTVSPFMNQTINNVSVLGCLTYGVRSAPGDLECQNGMLLSVNTTVWENRLATLFVPYPEAGTWYLRLKSECYNSSVSIPCSLSDTPISLRIRSTPCILGKCGVYGTCDQYVSGGLIFSTCDCIAGWKGWGCTDNSTARPDAKLLLYVLLLTLSNLLFIPAVILSIYRKYYAEAFVYFSAMLSSSFYHACDAEVFSYCLIPKNVLQFWDFYSAILSIWVTLLAMARLPSSMLSFFHMSGAIGVALGVEYDRTGLWVFVIPTGIGLGVLFSSWFSRCYKKHVCYPERKIWLCYLLPGALLALSGLVVYAFFQTKDNYPYVHSAWHAAIALSIPFLLPKQNICIKSTPEPTTSCSVRVSEVNCPDVSNPIGTPYTQLLAPSP